MIEKLKKDYKWLFTSKRFMVVNGKKQFYNVEMKPVIEDHGSHYRVYKQKDSSPLILSKNY